MLGTEHGGENAHAWVLRHHLESMKNIEDTWRGEIYPCVLAV